MAKMDAIRDVCVALIVIMMSASLIGCSGATGDVVMDDRLKIGVLLPLTGASAEIGQNARLGIEKAMADGDPDHLLAQVIFEDNKNDPKEAVIAAKKLIEIDDVDLLITSMSGASLAVAPLAKEAGIPLIATVVFVDVTKDYQDSFQVYFDPQGEAKALLDLAQKSGLQDIGILYAENDYGQAIAREVIMGAEGIGKKVVVSQGYSLSEQSFKTELEKIKSREPQILYLVTFPQHVKTQLREAQEIGLGSQIAVNSIAYANGIWQDDPLFEGKYISMPSSYTLRENQDRYASDFQARFPKGNTYIPYDVMSMVLDSLKIGKKDVVGHLQSRSDLETSLNGRIEVQGKRAVFDLTMVKVGADGDISLY